VEELPHVDSDPPKETPTARTSKHIAYWLLALYSGSLLAIGVFAGILELAGRGSAGWFDLLKSGFLILGGSLSTVVGYYFGSRGIQEAEAYAREAERRTKAALAELAEQMSESRRLQNIAAPTLAEEPEAEGGLILPEDSAP